MFFRPIIDYLQRIEGTMAGKGHNEEKFKAAVLAHSRSQIWDEAKAEWQLYSVYNDAEDRSCECEHSPIHQICIIFNVVNDNKLEVGNVCVKRFLRLLSQRIFSVVKRIKTNIDKSLNPLALQLFRERGVITHEDEQNYLSYWRIRKNLTDKQKIHKFKINTAVLLYVESESPKIINNAKSLGLNV